MTASDISGRASIVDLVALGRPVLYGLHLGGSKGVESVLRHMKSELENTMLLSGVKNLEELRKYAKVERYR